MRILMIVKYPPIQGGVSAECYWTAQLLADIGHEVHVLTNAKEVEAEYRMAMTESDNVLLSGFNSPNSVHLHNTLIDKKHVFIPQTNPSVSKLLSLGLEIIEAHRPDLIWAHYTEPYGIVALLLSKMSGIPYVFRHAGSDIGRLMLTEQLKTIHQEVLRGARAIMTQPHHHDRFTEIGVPRDRLITSIAAKFHPSIFFPTPRKVGTPFILGIYGKTGPAKGTEALLDAVAVLSKDGYPVELRAHWGGRTFGKYEEMIRQLDPGNILQVNGFIPHWHIPNFIRSCDAILFLENKFRITFHHPSVPLEAISCGRPVITTEEIASKPKYRNLIQEPENAFVIRGDVTSKSVLLKIREAHQHLLKAGEMNFPPAFPRTDVHLRVRMRAVLDQIEARI